MHQLDLYTEHLIRHEHERVAAHVVRRHLIRETLAARPARFYRPALVSIGRQMVIWGTKLQRRYSDLHSAPETPPEVILANK